MKKLKWIVKKFIRKFLLKCKLYRTYFRFRYHNKYYFILKNLTKNINKLESISIETTTDCNRKCTFCPLTFDNSTPKYMNTDLFYKILDDMDDMSFDGRIIMNNYGEPLLDKRLLKFIKYIKKRRRNVKIEFYTNGDMLTPKIAKKFINNGTDLIVVAQHDLKSSMQIKRLKSYNWRGKIRFIITNINSVWLSSRTGLLQIPSYDPINCLLNDMIIRADGVIPLCCNDYYDEVTFGNIKDKSIKEIWTSEAYKKVRKNLKWGKFDLEICKRCRSETKKEGGEINEK